MIVGLDEQQVEFVRGPLGEVPIYMPNHQKLMTELTL